MAAAAARRDDANRDVELGEEDVKGAEEAELVRMHQLHISEEQR